MKELSASLSQHDALDRGLPYLCMRINSEKAALYVLHLMMRNSCSKKCMIDMCFTARQHKIGQFVPIYQGDCWLRRLRMANEEHIKTYSCMRYNEHTHATTNNRYAFLA